MLLMIDEKTGEAKKIGGEQPHAVLADADRLRSELDAWLGYKKKAQREERYKKVAAQELTHALMALSDLLTAMQGQMTEGEMADFKDFCNVCFAK